MELPRLEDIFPFRSVEKFAFFIVNFQPGGMHVVDERMMWKEEPAAGAIEVNCH